MYWMCKYYLRDLLNMRNLSKKCTECAKCDKIRDVM